MSIKYYNKFFLLIPMILVGCSSDLNTSEEIDMLDRVKLSAEISVIGNSRTYQEDGPVIEGRYNITYRNNERNFEVGWVNFEDKNGFAFKSVNGNTSDLKWNDISTDEIDVNTYSFYLDNLPEEFGSETLVGFPTDKNPYIASVFDSERGTNDIIWGSLENINRAPQLNFVLRHVMSRFCLRIYFDNSLGLENLEPKSANIENLFKEPLTFNRLTGSLGLKESPDSDPFILVRDLEEWEKQEDEETEMTYYVSPDFVIPPQDFVSNMRPRLNVELTNGNSYSGLFPLAMNLIDENGVITPWTMSFLRGYKLTLNVKISNTPPSIQFMPVTIIEWVDKGTYLLTGKQASVDKEADLLDLVNAYNSGDKDQFYKWGYYNESEGKWIFNIFQSIIIDIENFRGESENKGIMPVKEEMDYAFYFHNNVLVDVILDNNDRKARLTGSEGAEKLFNLLSSGDIPDATEEELIEPDEDDENLTD